MSNEEHCWSLSRILMISAIVGLIALLLFLLALGFKFWGSLLWGIIIGAVTFLILWLNFGCTGDGSVARGGASGAGTASGSAGAAAAGVAAAGAGAAAASSAASSSAASAASTDDVASAAASDGAPSSGASDSASSAAADDAASAGSSVASGNQLSGQEELASRKGEWTYDGGADAAGSDAGAGSSNGSADAGAGSAGGSAASDSGSDATAASSKPKAGGKAKSGAKAKAEGKGKAGSKAKASSKSSPMDGGDKDYDGDGIMEGTDEGTKPAMLDGPRDGGADNLKEVKGIGPKLEKLCNSLGVYHFDQIAGWGPQEVAWMDANLQGFRGRVSRDDWVGQAKILAAGGETEFSKRVDDGNVY